MTSSSGKKLSHKKCLKLALQADFRHILNASHHFIINELYVSCPTRAYQSCDVNIITKLKSKNEIILISVSRFGSLPIQFSVVLC